MCTAMEALTLASKAKMVSPVRRSVHHFCLFVWTFFRQNFTDAQGDCVAIATTPKFRM